MSKGPFSDKQRRLILGVLAEATDLLDTDARQLSLSDRHAERLGLPAGATYGHALAAVVANGDKAQARDMTGAVLALRQDPRVQGHELELTQDERR
jgi:hypothetical protein